MLIAPPTSPEVSVVMPVRNAGRFLCAALGSVLSQTGIGFEVICVDDGSCDDSWLTLQEFGRQHEYLRVLRAETGGISAALNQGLALSRGRFVARMDADDICLPGRLRIQARWLDAHPAIGVLGTQAWVIDETGAIRGQLRTPVGPARVRAMLPANSPLLHPTVMMRRELVLAAGGYRSVFDGAEDYDLWLRLDPAVQMDNLPRPLLLYRRHSGQQTVSRPFHHARLAALAAVAYRLRRECRFDPTSELNQIAEWRVALAAIDPAAVEEVRLLTACRLADNGGTLRPSGAVYLRLACRVSAGRANSAIRRRLALACVRHELQSFRHGRWTAAGRALVRDAVRWRSGLIRAYFHHASILWRARRLVQERASWGNGTDALNQCAPAEGARPGAARRSGNSHPTGIPKISVAPAQLDRARSV